MILTIVNNDRSSCESPRKFDFLGWDTIQMFIEKERHQSILAWVKLPKLKVIF